MTVRKGICWTHSALRMCTHLTLLERRCHQTLDMSSTEATPEPNVSATIVAAVTQTWLYLALLAASEPGGNFGLWILLLFVGLGLALTWLVVLVPTAYRAWRTSSGARAKIIGYLLPIPLAVTLLVVLMALDIPLMTRFELSEGALSDFVERYESADSQSFSGSEWVGLFKIDRVYRRDGCLVLHTYSYIDYETGFAYCTGSLPSSPTVHMDHLKGPWWIYENIH